MPLFETAQLVLAVNKVGQDRVAIIGNDERTVLVVADGAGGIGHGDLAADAVIREVKSATQSAITAADWEAQLRQIDCRIGVGESTAVIVDLSGGGICGASVGDSCAWIVHDGELIDLTAQQIRKPLLGSGNAQPKAFTSGSLAGTLLVATDGFTNYVKRDRLTRLVAESEFVELPRRCVELVRLPSGDLWDDVAVIACRVQRRRARRICYTI